MSILGGKIDIFGGYVYSLDMSDHSPFDPNVPYNNLPPLPPRDEVETVAVLKAVIAANKELGALDSACRLIPNPAIITSTIPLREAQASSEIENIVTTNDELFRAAYAVDAEPTPATKEALRYNKALHLGVESLATRPLSIHTAQQVCSALQDAPAVVRSMPGTYIGDPVKKIKFYTPPEGKEIIEQHLSQWERFIYSDHGLDPLVLLALLHYQFEAIHPFYDGNGRTGRILNILLLVQEGLLRLPVLYLSGYIVNNKADYYSFYAPSPLKGHGKNGSSSLSKVLKNLRALRQRLLRNFGDYKTGQPLSFAKKLASARPRNSQNSCSLTPTSVSKTLRRLAWQNVRQPHTG